MGQCTSNDSMRLRTVAKAAHKNASFITCISSCCKAVCTQQFSEDTCWDSCEVLEARVIFSCQFLQEPIVMPVKPGLHHISLLLPHIRSLIMGRIRRMSTSRLQIVLHYPAVLARAEINDAQKSSG